MTVDVHAVLGHRDDDAFAGRTVDGLPVGVFDASRRRLRGTTDGGLDVTVDLDEPTYLADGVVLADDGAVIVAVERTAMDTLVVTVDLDQDPGAILRSALLLGHAFGNQHVGLEVVGAEVLVPVTTSPDVALGVVERLGPSLRAVVEPRRLALAAPLHTPHAS